MRWRAWALDLDGVIWRGRRTLPGAPEAVARLRRRGDRVVFVTNNSARTPAQVVETLAAHRVTAGVDEIVTSSLAAATLLRSGETVLVVGGPGVRAAVAGAGAEVVDAVALARAGTRRAPTCDAVVVGITPDFDYAVLTLALGAVDAGARLIATNDDPTFPVADGIAPGNGALVAAVERATGRRATVAGKPHEAMAVLVRAALGAPPGAGEPAGSGSAASAPILGAVMVGDRPDTDGLFARRAGLAFALVLSGVTAASDLPVEPRPDLVAADLAEVVDRAVGEHAGDP